MEIDLSIDFAERYSTTDKSSTAMNINISQLSGHEGRCDTNGTGEYEAFYSMAQFVSGVIIYPVLCITGILGNSLSLMVLSHKDMATSTNIYLLALGISDSLKLLNDFLYFVMLVISLHNPQAAESMMVNVYPYAHYVFQVAVCGTAWLTVSVSMDRYISVCYPSTSKLMCTIPKARAVVVSVFVIMVLISIPSGFRYRLQTFHDPTNNMTCMELVVTELGRNREFMIPYTWIQNLLRGIIPVFILVFLNARIINVLRKERIKGKKFNSRNRITLMLIAMVVVFIVCITPDAIMSTFFGKGYVEEDALVKGVREITDSLLALNSAVNFILYCSLSAIFRKTFMRVFFGKRYKKVGGRSSKRGSQDVTSISMKKTERCSGRNRKYSGCVKYGRSCQKNSSSQLDFFYFEGNSEENSPKSEVTLNGFSKTSGDRRLSNFVNDGDEASGYQPRSVNSNSSDARLTFSVYTGPTDVVKFPWETSDSRVRESNSNEMESDGVQL